MTPRLFYEYKQSRAGEVSTDTVNMELRTFQTMFKLAKTFRYVTANPVEEVDRDKSESDGHRFMTLEEIDAEARACRLSKAERRKLLRFRYLTVEEVREILDLARGKQVHLMLCVAAYTGARKGEILRLEWSDLDFQKKKVFLRSRKGSTSKKFTVRDVDMHPKLATALRERRKANPEGRYVVAGEGGRPVHKDMARRWIEEAVEGSSFEHVGFHTLRHSFASNLAAKGVDDRIIDHFMGHQTAEMRKRYQRLFPGKKRDSILMLEI